jgi:acetylornithine deacetylase/succinyl-diaminopimelate desuccinylase-like protein
VNCRVFPGETVADAQRALEAAIANPAIRVEALGNAEVSPVSEPRADVMDAITRSIHRRYPGVPVTPYLESGGTDGAVYRRAGIPTWSSSGIFMKDGDMFAHGLNERIPAKSFYEALEHLHDLAVELGGR